MIYVNKGFMHCGTNYDKLFKEDGKIFEIKSICK